MKGLLAKDFALFSQRKRTFIFLALWAIVMSATMDDSGFVIGWMTIISGFFAISSLNYDEYDNCMPFIMSLPVTGKIYAREKYLFGIICGLGAWIFAAVVYLVVALVKKTGIDFGTEIIQMAIMIPVCMLLIDVSLPINMKYGSERGRMIILIIWGVVFFALFAATKFLHMDIEMSSSAAAGAGIVAAAFVIAAIATIVSIKISTGIMNKKEF